MTPEEAFDRHHQAVYRFAYRLTRRADLAEDITQDCFLALVRAPSGSIRRGARCRCTFSPLRATWRSSATALSMPGNRYAANKRSRDGAEPNFRPTLKVATHDLGAAVEIRIRDNGTGIAPEIRDKLFQPFFTTKPTGEGTGLGLSISWDIVTKQHGGTIAVDIRVDEFTEFAIHLPRPCQTTTTTTEAAT